MICTDYQRRLSAYLDGELSRWTRWKVEFHARHCAACGEELRSLAAVDQMLLRSVERSPAPDYLTDAVMRRLPALPPTRRTARRLAPWAAALALAGAQLTALVGAYWVGFQRGNVQTGGVGNVPQLSRREQTRVQPAATPGRGAAFVAPTVPASSRAPRGLFNANPRYLTAPVALPLDRHALPAAPGVEEGSGHQILPSGMRSRRPAPALPSLLPLPQASLRLGF